MDAANSEKGSTSAAFTVSPAATSNFDQNDSPSQAHREDGSPEGRQMYRNSLLAAVGWLDLTNSLDFPANVWNDDPLPTFVKVLMGLGGSIAVLAVIFAVWDAIRSLRNLSFLRHERRHLQASLSRPDLDAGRRGLIQAWLGINLRELGWEYIDRLALDVAMGISGLLIGSGTLMAIRGDIPAVFQASNYLSGYVGNAFLAFYAVFNALWSAYMFQKAWLHGKAFRDPQLQIDEETRRKLRFHTWHHQVYAVITAFTMLLAGAASMVSATMWVGYCILAPCVLASIFINWYWRKRLGYDRASFRVLTAPPEPYDILANLRSVLAVTSILKGRRSRSPDLSASLVGGEKSSQDLVTFIRELGLQEEFQRHLPRHAPEDSKEGSREDMPDGEVIRAAIDATLRECPPIHFVYYERFLLELYGYWLVPKPAKKALC